ncbi:hypothetical protein [Actinoplanes derwentensis]|uniref:Uncharacterized protein n=1 Tax=Actinoplanes derwentensis TaxID=113562 RepID=A0A1H1WZW8_9ACTN|nr:hypothetical protein [Actinoplanes derwentensis]GID85774.1 hypothetical protein Ade03nite_46980 [Actinoplanes derwentensis]SDT02350.1 hypothetical protein SAMN04489716_2283 [Actinoplanes derwentensis]
MTDLEPFGARLTRLLDLRGMSAADLSGATEVPVTRLGLEIAEIPWNVSHPWPVDLVELAWAARHLDDGQIRATMDFADTLTGRITGTRPVSSDRPER